MSAVIHALRKDVTSGIDVEDYVEMMNLKLYFIIILEICRPRRAHCVKTSVFHPRINWSTNCHLAQKPIAPSLDGEDR